MEKKYKVALIGCGVMGEAHVAQIHALEDIEVAYVCDTHLDRAVRFQQKYHVTQISDDAKEILRDESITIVIIATPPSTHLKLVRECLEMGKHVLCEKPITNSLADAEEFVRLTEAFPLSKLLVGNILRHNKTYQTLAKMIQEDCIGHPLIFRMTQNHHTMDWPQYLANIIECAPLVNCGIHYMDVMEWFSGEKPMEVKAIGSRTDTDVPENTYNYGLMSIRFDKGSIGYYEAGWANTCSSDNTKEIIGPRGRLKLTYQKDRQSHSEEGDLIEFYQYPEKTYTTINCLSERKPTDVQLYHLIRMIETGCETIPTLKQVLSSMKTCFEADAQAKECAGNVFPSF